MVLELCAVKCESNSHSLPIPNAVENVNAGLGVSTEWSANQLVILGGGGTPSFLAMRADISQSLA